MSTACSICRLAVAGAIDDRLRSGDTARAVASEYGLSYDALTRHARNHLPRRLTPVPDAPPTGDPLDELVDALRKRALAGDPVVAREYRLALQAQSARDGAAAPKVDLASEPEWTAFRGRMLDALEPFPAARLAIVAALRGLA